MLSFQLLRNLRDLLIRENIFIPEPEEGDEQSDDRQNSHRHAQAGFRGRGYALGEVDRLLRFGRGLIAE